MAQKKLSNVTLENVRIIWRNFSGKGDQFNPEGNRNFNVVLDEKDALAMQADGWNVKRKDPREEGDDPLYILQVTVSYKARPPRVVMITSRGRTNLDEQGVAALDWVDIENVDLILNPFEWEVGAKKGIKAYLHAIYVTIREDELERKYSGVDEVNRGQVTERDEWAH